MKTLTTKQNIANKGRLLPIFFFFKKATIKNIIAINYDEIKFLFFLKLSLNFFYCSTLLFPKWRGYHQVIRRKQQCVSILVNGTVFTYIFVSI